MFDIYIQWLGCIWQNSHNSPLEWPEQEESTHHITSLGEMISLLQTAGVWSHVLSVLSVCIWRIIIFKRIIKALLMSVFSPWQSSVVWPAKILLPHMCALPLSVMMGGRHDKIKNRSDEVTAWAKALPTCHSQFYILPNLTWWIQTSFVIKREFVISVFLKCSMLSRKQLRMIFSTPS